MAEIRVDVERIDKMERFRTVITADDGQGILAFNRHTLQTITKLFRERILGVSKFLWLSSFEIKTECAVDLARKRGFRQEPEGARSFRRSEKLRITIDVSCVVVQCPAMQCFVYFLSTPDNSTWPSNRN